MRILEYTMYVMKYVLRNNNKRFYIIIKQTYTSSSITAKFNNKIFYIHYRVREKRTRYAHNVYYISIEMERRRMCVTRSLFNYRHWYINDF